VNVHAPEPFAVVVPREFAASNTSTVEFASAVPEKVGVESFTIAPSVGEVMLGAAGAVASIVKAMATDAALVLVAASVALAVIECAPSGTLELGVNVHAPEPLAVAVPSEVEPARKTSMVALASDVPVKVGVLSFVVVPVVGAVMLGAAGAVVSTVIDTAVDAALVLFPLSVAFAVNE
jgi:hypothetical protein